MFEVLNRQYSAVSEPTRAILLSAYLKLCKEWPQLVSKVQPIFKKHASQIDPEIQQRSVEYLGLLSQANRPLLVRCNQHLSSPLVKD